MSTPLLWKSSTKILNDATGPTEFVLPLSGISMLSIEGEDLQDPEADAALFDAIHEILDDDIGRIEIDLAINDGELALTLARHLDERLREAGHDS